jgi:hypothetical protein
MAVEERCTAGGKWAVCLGRFKGFLSTWSLWSMTQVCACFDKCFLMVLECQLPELDSCGDVCWFALHKA